MSVSDAVPFLSPKDGQRASMEAELKELRKQQHRALEVATYVGMGAADAQEYEHRAQRITQLQVALGVKPEFTMGLAFQSGIKD